MDTLSGCCLDSSWCSTETLVGAPATLKYRQPRLLRKDLDKRVR